MGRLQIQCALPQHVHRSPFRNCSSYAVDVPRRLQGLWSPRHFTQFPRASHEWFGDARRRGASPARLLLPSVLILHQEVLMLERVSRCACPRERSSLLTARPCADPSSSGILAKKAGASPLPLRCASPLPDLCSKGSMDRLSSDDDGSWLQHPAAPGHIRRPAPSSGNLRGG